MGFQKYFRTGAEKGTSAEAILDDLNDSFGSAYNTEPGSIIYIENLAFARAISDLFDSVERLKNQSHPPKMTTSIPRWEKILGITPRSDATDSERRRAIGAKLALFNVAPTDQATKDYLNRLIPELIVELIYTNSDDAVGAVPGGVAITGGVTLQDGPWQSYVCYIAIRVHQPLNMSDQEYYSKVETYKAAIDNFLPAHVIFKHGRFTYEIPGTITVAQSSTSVSGSSTLFTADPSLAVIGAGTELECFDDNGKLTRLFVQSVTNNTALVLSIPSPSAVTAKKARIKGFMLGVSNLDNAFI